MTRREFGNRLRKAIVAEAFLLFLLLPFACVFFLIALLTLPPASALAASVRGLLAFSGILWIALILFKRYHLKIEARKKENS